MCGGRKAMAEVGEEIGKVLGGQEVVDQMRKEDRMLVEVWGE